MNDLTKDVLSLFFNSAILITVIAMFYRAGLLISAVKSIGEAQRKHEESAEIRWKTHEAEEGDHRVEHQGQHIREGITRNA